MEAHSGQFRSVHVLRHTFRPSEALAGKLKEMVDTERGSVAPQFILTSSREVAVDELEYQNYRYDTPIYERRREFHAHTGGIALQAAAYKFTPQGDFKLRFTPKDAGEFTALTDPIDTLPDIIDRSARGGRYFVQLQLNASRLIAREALAKVWHNLRVDINNEATNRLYGVFPHDISGPERTVANIVYVNEYTALSSLEYDGLI